MDIKSILVVNIGWTTKPAGGDHHILKVAEYWSKNHKMFYLLPRLGYDYSKSFLRGKSLVYNSSLEKEPNNFFQVILLYIFRIIKILFHPPEEKFNVVIASSHFLYDIIAATYIALKNSPCKLIVFYHGLSVKNGNLLMQFCRRMNDVISITLIRKYFDLVFAINTLVEDFLVLKGINEQKIKLTSNAVDITLKCAVSDDKEFDSCFLGRLIKSKGIFDLVAVWKIITKELNGKLLIIGDGSDKQELMKRIKEENLEDRILLLGYLNEEKYDKMAKSKIFLFPSYSESWCISIAEALASGLPVIAYDLPIYHEVFGDCIITVPKGNIRQMAEKAIFILRNGEIREKYSKAGKNFIKIYNWEEVARKELFYIKGA